MVLGFTVDAYRDRLRALHDQNESEGPFVGHSSRYLIEAREPTMPSPDDPVTPVPR